MEFNNLVNLLLEELKIVAPAVKLPSGKVIPGKKGDMHANVHDRIIDRLAAINNVPKEAAANKFYKMWGEGKFKDGFIDSEGEFQTREKAWEISKKYNKKVQRMSAERLGSPGKMASEWIPEDE